MCTPKQVISPRWDSVFPSGLPTASQILTISSLKCCRELAANSTFPGGYPYQFKRRRKAKGKHLYFPASGGAHCWGPLTLLKPGGHVAQDVGRVQNLRDIVPESVQILPLLGRHARSLTCAPLPLKPAVSRQWFSEKWFQHREAELLGNLN